jgi:hypothetical protein
MDDSDGYITSDWLMIDLPQRFDTLLDCMSFLVK